MHLSRTRRLTIAFAASFVLHLAAVLLIGDFWERSEQTRVFRARLAQPSRFEPRRLSGARQSPLPPRGMEYLRQAAEARDMPGSQLALPALHSPRVVGPSALGRRGEVGGRPDTFAVPPDESMPSPGRFGYTRSDGREALDLLRMQDMARAGRLHALSMTDPTTRRGLRGFLNVARLRAYGAGSDTGGVHALARS